MGRQDARLVRSNCVDLYKASSMRARRRWSNVNKKFQQQQQQLSTPKSFQNVKVQLQQLELRHDGLSHKQLRFFAGSNNTELMWLMRTLRK